MLLSAFVLRVTNNAVAVGQLEKVPVIVTASSHVAYGGPTF